MVRVGPFHTRNVKVVRIAGGFHPDGFAGVEGSYTDANGRIASARFRIWINKRLGIDADLGVRNLGDDFSSRAVQVVDESEVFYAFRVELPKGDGPAVGAPLEAVANVELFFVNPIGGAIDDGGGAIVRSLRDFWRSKILDVNVVGADVGDFGIVGRELGEHQRGGSSVATEFAKSPGLQV